MITWWIVLGISRYKKECMTEKQSRESHLPLSKDLYKFELELAGTGRAKLDRSKIDRYAQDAPAMREAYLARRENQPLSVLEIGVGNMQEPVSYLRAIEQESREEEVALRDAVDLEIVEIRSRSDLDLSHAGIEPSLDLSGRARRLEKEEIREYIKELVDNPEKSHFNTSIEEYLQESADKRYQVVACNNVLQHMGGIEGYKSPFKNKDATEEDLKMYYSVVEGIVNKVEPGGLLIIHTDGSDGDQFDVKSGKAPEHILKKIPIFAEFDKVAEGIFRRHDPATTEDERVAIITSRQQKTKQKEALAEQIFKESLEHNAWYKAMTKDIPPSFLPSKAKTIFEGLKPLLDELEGDSEVSNLYEKIILKHDREVLKKKSELQYKELESHYYGKIPALLQPQKRKKFEEFREYVANLALIRGDVDIALKELKSPRITETTRSFGTRDIATQADAYVSTIFEDLPRHMEGGEREKQVIIDKEGIEERSELLMQDIANIEGRSRERVIERYLTNLFDYKTGKEILALYLAKVFNNPQEASDFIKGANVPIYAQMWDKGYLERDVHEDARVRTLEIVDAMKEIFHETGVEPPLSLEVRIRDSVKVEAIVV